MPRGVTRLQTRICVGCGGLQYVRSNGKLAPRCRSCSAAFAKRKRTKICPTCDAKFNSYRTRYCSRICAARRTRAPRKPAALKKCTLCTIVKPVVEFYCSGEAKTPSGRCRACFRIGREVAEIDRVCCVCGVAFTGHINRKFCGTSCRRQARPRAQVDCFYCGIRFPADRRGRVFCSRVCMYAARRAAPTRANLGVRTEEANTAYRLLHSAIRSGIVPKPDQCQRCGRGGCRIEGAHHDYTKPLDVEWLCVPCHRRWDNAQPKGGTKKAAAMHTATALGALGVR